MRVRPPKAWQSLPQGQKDKIEEHAKNVALEQMEKDARVIIDLYIKMVCMTLHNVFGFGEKRLNLFLANHRMLFREQVKLVRNNTQIQFLNDEMEKIFRKNGFPQGMFDKTLGPVEMPNNEGGLYGQTEDI